VIPPRRPKYYNVPTEYDGRTYASKAEAERARQLDMLKRAGDIRHWEPQPRFRLGCTESVYVADMIVWNRDGSTHVEDVKGVRTAKFNRDVKLWRSYGPCPLHVIGKGGNLEVIEPTPGDAGRESER
jgi:hypothetical protein